MTYAGHHRDGSGIQNHSAGPIYPYVIQVRERANKDGSFNRTWELLAPNGSITIHQSLEQAFDTAHQLLTQKRNKEAALALAKAVAPFEAVIRQGSTTLIEISRLVLAVQDGTISRQDRQRYDVLVGLSNLAKSFSQRSVREDLIVA